jgi:type IV secretion system protein VirD4
MVLDEAALICPVPLDRWTADMGGRNIRIVIVAQSVAQLRQRWGKDGAEIILGNTANLLVFGGSNNKVDLEDYSKLSGDREEIVEVKDKDGKLVSTSTRRVSVLSASQIGSLPRGVVMLRRRGVPGTAIGRTAVASHRRDVRAARGTFELPVETNFEAELEEEL